MRIQNNSVTLFGLKPNNSDSGTGWGPAITVFLTLGIYIFSQVIGGLLVSVYPLYKGWNAQATEAWLKSSVVPQFSLILIIELLVVVMIFGLLKLRRTNLKNVGLKKPRWSDLAYALTGFGIYFLIYVTLFITARQLFPHVNFEQKQDIGFENITGGLGLFLTFLSLVIFPPIAEEIFCRGFLYTGLREKWPRYKASMVALVLAIFSLMTYAAFRNALPVIAAIDIAAVLAILTNRKHPKLTAAVITSIIFASAHLEFGSGAPLLWAAALDTFTLSLVLIYLRQSRDSLMPAIMLHMLKNSVAFMILFIFAVR